MNDPFFEVITPQLGVNDEYATIVEWRAAPGAAVRVGQILAILETTKASVELECEAGGFFYPLVETGERVAIRRVIGLILPAPDPDAAERYRKRAAAPPDAGPLPAETPGDAPRMTLKARKLLEAYGIDPAVLPKGRILREQDIAALAHERPPSAPTPEPKPAPAPRTAAPVERVAIVGASYGGQVILEYLAAIGECEVVAFVEDAPERAGAEFLGLPILPGADLAALKERGIQGLATHIGHKDARLRLLRRAREAGLELINVVHPSAYVAPSVRMGAGNLVKAGAILDAEVQLGDCCIIDNGVIIPHHNRIGDACHLAPGVSFGGDCIVGPRTVIGVGATVSPRLRIGANVIIGAGAAVVRDVPDNAVVEGRPARVAGETRG